MIRAFDERNFQIAVRARFGGEPHVEADVIEERRSTARGTERE
jgi:hypothetical protein